MSKREKEQTGRRRIHRVIVRVVLGCRRSRSVLLRKRNEHLPFEHFSSTI